MIHEFYEMKKNGEKITFLTSYDYPTAQFQAFTPIFVKKYCNVAEIITDAMKTYCEEVRAEKFPSNEHCYGMIKGEADMFLRLMGSAG